MKKQLTFTYNNNNNNNNNLSIAIQQANAVSFTSTFKSE